jgi:pyruvate, water dikinase
MKRLLLLLAACGDPPAQFDCVLPAGDVPSSLAQIGCEGDFAAIASEPPDSSIPGARSVKTVLDRSDGDALYFQNSQRYAIHWAFASENLSGRGLPIVGTLDEFNAVEYYSPDRRFVLGAVTYYEGPQVWTYEISPYDTASAEMIAQSFEAIRAHAYFGDELKFHPTSSAVEREAQKLPDSIPQISTDELFAGIDYQPLNLATALGRLRFAQADSLETNYLDFREIVVLDRVPNDISVVSGIITAEFQTPLSHINVLSQNRGTPNMGLRGALERAELSALEGRWVRLVVGPFEWSIEEVTQAEADAWWDAHRPEQVQVPRIDPTVTALVDIDRMLDASLPMKARIKAAIPAFGGKAAHYAELFSIDGITVQKAFAIPVFYYRQHLEQNGIDAEIAAMLEDPEFQNSPSVRDAKLNELRDRIRAAPIDPAFMAMLQAKVAAEYENGRMRFRSSTNAEDLDGFTGAGLYTSKTGDPNDPMKPMDAAIKSVWASVWYFRAFEERSYRGIDHQAVGMALLVTHSFPDEYANGVALTANPFDTSGLEPDEYANGVALTANPFDTSGLEPGQYINVQRGEASVVMPDSGVTSDEFIYQFELPGQPIIFISHSSLVPAGENVLSVEQTFALGDGLQKVHQHFFEAYGPPLENPLAWYGMDVEFKFDEPRGGGPIQLFLKQARPHPGRGR